MIKLSDTQAVILSAASQRDDGAVLPLPEALKIKGGAVDRVLGSLKATGWQHHTIRGAISGALKKKLGLTVEATRTRQVGPNKTGAKGSSTVYRITGGGPRIA
jgi:hypothetical protein